MKMMDEEVMDPIPQQETERLGTVIGAAGMGVPTEERCYNGPTNGTIDNRATHEINIQSLNYGYLVRVGCQTFAIETTEKLIQAFSAYVRNPEHIQKQWFAGKFLR